jgi:hypothetical protein
MKSVNIYLLTIFLGMALLAAPGTRAGGFAAFGLSDEDYIDDIPFDTRSVALRSGVPPFTLEEEGYIDDIPFDTKRIACQALFGQMMDCREEAYVDDIPFSTEEIYREYLVARLTGSFRMEENGSSESERSYFSSYILPIYRDEHSVEDIGFDTRVKALEAMFESCLANYLEEPETPDLFAGRVYTICLMHNKENPELIISDNRLFDAGTAPCFQVRTEDIPAYMNRVVRAYETEEIRIIQVPEAENETIIYIQSISAL